MRSVLIKRAPWAVRDVSLGYLWNAQCGVLSKPRKICGVLSLFMSLFFRNVTDGITMWGPSHRIPQSPWLVTCLTIYICSFLSLLFLKTSNHWLLSLKRLIFFMLTFLLIQKQIPAILVSRWNVHLRLTVSSPFVCVCVCVCLPCLRQGLLFMAACASVAGLRASRVFLSCLPSHSRSTEILDMCY